MKKIKYLYWVLFVVLTVLWLHAEQPWAQHYTLFELRATSLDYTGILAIGAMSLAMMLALRPVTVEPFLGGLDKSYRLHKWLGVSALVLSVVHWLWHDAVVWLIDSGLLARPERGPRPLIEDPVQQVFMMLRKPAEAVGEWAFYVGVVLMLLALIKWFPYRYFFKTHRLIAIVYLILAFHSVVLIKYSHWQTPVAWVMLLLIIGGTVGAVFSLTRRIGHQRRALGVVEALTHHTGNQVLKVDIQLPQDRWEGHDAGQFAFVSFTEGEAHPFTISSAWKNDGRLAFHIKELGDHTARLPATLKVGDRATVEGPYGCFRFESDRPRQIWVGGGIGITPFMARMEERAGQDARPGEAPQVDLFYSTKNADEAFVANLQRLAERAGVKLHIIVAGRDALPADGSPQGEDSPLGGQRRPEGASVGARLDAEGLCATVPEWKETSLWFCGPAGFGHALRQGLARRGFDTRHFHQELFDMR